MAVFRRLKQLHGLSYLWFVFAAFGYSRAASAVRS